MPINQHLTTFVFSGMLLAAANSSAATAATAEPAQPITTHDSHAWSYVGNTGPAHWGELSKDYLLCAKGKQQSPIALNVSSTKPEAELKFTYNPAGLNTVNNGHSLQQDFTNSKDGFEYAGHNYKLVQLHFHVPSEHSVGGKRYPMEMHIVHQDENGQNAVIGMFIEKGKSSPSMTTIFTNLPETPGVHEQKSAVTIDPAEFIPSNHNAWHYSGSLTTPPCAENVEWFVMQQPITIAAEELQSFTKNIIPFNSRPLQNLNGRKVELLQAK